MKKLLLVLLAILLIPVIVYLSGPRAEFETVETSPLNIEFPIRSLDRMIWARESAVDGIKEDNQSQFFWIDSFERTEYSLLYLHGFSASHGEAQPILDNFAKRYRVNAYYPRLYLHGLEDVDVFKHLNPSDLVDSAREAIAIAKSIGHKVIIVSTSTGSTLAACLAAHDPDIAGLICLSPNFDLYDQRTHLLTGPWGKQIFRKMMGGDYRQWNASEEAQKYWTTKNRIEAHIALRDLLDQCMSESTFNSIDIPFYVAYYYKDEENMDKIISIDAIKKYYAFLSTPEDKKQIVAFDDARGHVIGSSIMNPNWASVQTSIFEFVEEKMHLRAVPADPAHMN